LQHVGTPSPAAGVDQSLFDAAGADFALDLLRQLLQQKQLEPGSSLVVSPFSVACMLALVHAGAQDHTAEQLAAVLAGDAQGMHLHHPLFKIIYAINYKLWWLSKVGVTREYTVFFEKISSYFEQMSLLFSIHRSSKSQNLKK
jgi:serine protease inhibitor